jgi:hypothetical protein
MNRRKPPQPFPIARLSGLDLVDMQAQVSSIWLNLRDFIRNSARVHNNPRRVYPPYVYNASNCIDMTAYYIISKRCLFRDNRSFELQIAPSGDWEHSEYLS